MNSVLAIALGILGLAADSADSLRLILKPVDVGKLPAGWSAAQTGEGRGSVWRVAADKSAKNGLVLAQTAKGPNALYNICVADAGRFGRDVHLSVALQAQAGELDRGGGLVWLYRDAKNYYVSRYNPLESNFRLYCVKDGKRVQLATRDDVQLDGKAWHTITVVHRGTAITCTLDGKFKLDVTDSTFTQPGRVGLWTKADAQTHFESFEARPAAH